MTRLMNGRARSIAVVLAVVVTLLTASCSMQAKDLPLPGNNVSGAGYPITIELRSVLNMPDKARVLVNGTQSGVLQSTSLVGDHAVANVRLRQSVRLTTSATAKLGQTTLLGDIYIAITQPPGDTAPPIRPHGVIPLSHTAPPDNVETVLAGVSTFLNGGSLTNLEQVVRQVNAVPMDSAGVQQVLHAGVAAVQDLGRNTATIGRILSSGVSVANSVTSRRSQLADLISSGTDRLSALANTLMTVVDLIVVVGPLMKPIGDLLVPNYGDLHDVLNVVDPVLVSVSTADRTIPQIASAAQQLITAKLIPYFSGGMQTNVRSVRSSAGPQDKTADTMKLLTAIGLLR